LCAPKLRPQREKEAFETGPRKISPGLGEGKGRRPDESSASPSPEGGKENKR